MTISSRFGSGDEKRQEPFKLALVLFGTASRPRSASRVLLDDGILTDHY